MPYLRSRQPKLPSGNPGDGSYGFGSNRKFVTQPEPTIASNNRSAKPIAITVDDDHGLNIVNGVAAPSKAYLRKQAVKKEVRTMISTVQKSDPLKLFRQAAI